MKRSARWLAPVLGATAIVVLFLLLRPDHEPSPVASPPTPTPTIGATVGQTPSPRATPEPTPTESPEPTPTETRDETTIEIEIQGGDVVGPREVEVPQGSRVELEVKADVTDEVHVHGYDLLATVTPDRRARIEFRATATGVFEVELEGAGLLLLQLVVVP